MIGARPMDGSSSRRILGRLINCLLYTSLPLSGIMDEIDRRLSCFDEPKTFDASTVRKKLKEYAEPVSYTHLDVYKRQPKGYPLETPNNKTG